jgi:hypothetical protein
MKQGNLKMYVSYVLSIIIFLQTVKGVSRQIRRFLNLLVLTEALLISDERLLNIFTPA